MTKERDFKRLVRARMERTGESYTAARAVLVERADTPLPNDLAPLAGMSEAAVQKATDRSWRDWVEALDEIDAATKPHAEIAAHIRDHYPDVSFWWAQSVTIGYERIRGLRDIGQRRDGGYDVNKSKTFPVAIEQLFRSFVEPASRASWLPDAELEERTTKPNRSVRWVWMDGTKIQCWFTDKGPSKSSVQIQHSGIATKELADEQRSFWAERLQALAERLR